MSIIPQTTQLCVCGDPDCTIPYGYCHCGCGELTSLAPSTQPKCFMYKGKPFRFVAGHNGLFRPKDYFERRAKKFWADLDKSAGPDGCWLWQGCRNAGGYGTLNFNRRHYIAHRFAYSLEFGPIPKGRIVCHKCDNPPCCNPAHLFLGTQTDNMRDMVKKGRHAGPYYNGKRKLTEAQVLELRKPTHPHTTTYAKSVAAQLGQDWQLVYRAMIGKTWKHLP